MYGPLVRYPTRHRFTEEDLDRMAEAGILYKGLGLELIDGDILEITRPDSPRGRSARATFAHVAFCKGSPRRTTSPPGLPPGELRNPRSSTKLASRPWPARARDGLQRRAAGSIVRVCRSSKRLETAAHLGLNSTRRTGYLLALSIGG
jgi:hypothetical protein